jgi:hypothetical protein
MAGVFALTGVLALLAIAVVKYLVPDPPPGVERGKAPAGSARACSTRNRCA